MAVRQYHRVIKINGEVAYIIPAKGFKGNVEARAAQMQRDLDKLAELQAAQHGEANQQQVTVDHIEVL